ncbi:MAG: serine hydrolase [Chloroflexi bacterium]|nr:serine hydrolase [Chloroflexota bacterium]
MKIKYGLVMVCMLTLTILPATGPETVNGQRDKLVAEELTTRDYRGDGPVHNDYFAPMGKFALPLHEFMGTLTILETVMEGIPPESGDGFDMFPGFSTNFFTYEDYLVPVARDIVPSSGEGSAWRIILSPGKVWSEPGDGGLSRASFPFVLTPALTNGAYNGLATFLYDDAHVSSLRFQIVQETSISKTAVPNSSDLWGQLPIGYTPGMIHNEESLRAQFSAELARQTPILPWLELSNNVDPRRLDAFNGGLFPEEISAAGMIVDGIIYLQPCATRYGDYPYCRAMRHGAYSFTKTMGALIAMLRLAQKYGDDVFDLRIEDYAPVTAVHDGWHNITFGDVLNMATGVGDSPNGDLFADEDSPKMSAWNNAPTTGAKLDAGFAFDNYAWGPGEVVRYNTSHTFILAVAMDNFLKSQEGPEVALWSMVTEEVFRPIGIYHAPILRTQKTVEEAGLPLWGIGLYVTVDDIAKITMLLQNGGQYDGQQLLSATKLAEALYQTENKGLPIDRQSRYGDDAYLMSLWSTPYRDGNSRFHQIPYMAGTGGNFVALLPNGVAGFRLADAENYDLLPLIKAGEAVRPFPASGGVAVESRLILPEKLHLVPAKQAWSKTLDRLLVGLIVVTVVFISAALISKKRSDGEEV